MSTWALIIVLSTGYGISSQKVESFKTEESCSVAGNHFHDKFDRFGTDANYLCVEVK